MGQGERAEEVHHAGVGLELERESEAQRQDTLQQWRCHDHQGGHKQKDGGVQGF